MMSFGGWVTSPLTAAFNACNAGPRLKMPSRLSRASRSLGTVLLTGMLGLALLLAGCGTDSSGGNGGDGRDDRTPRAVSNITTTTAGNSITVSWTNPDQANIIGFNMTWRNVAGGETESRMGPNAPADVAPIARVTDTITNLTYDTTYEITITVLYADGVSVNSVPAQVRTEKKPDDMTPDPRAATDIQTAVSGNNMTVRWTNPNRDNITGFNITWVNVDDDADGSTEELDSNTANVSAGASDNTHKITNLTYDATYEITITVLYKNGTSVVSAPVPGTTGADPATTPPGNGNGGNGGTSNPRTVSNIQTAVSRNNITVRWTNPNRENITGFNVTWFNVDDKTSDGGTKELDSDEADVAASASVEYKITDLTYAATYEITVTVLYKNGTSAVSAPVQSTTRLSADIDGDDDGVVNTEDLDYDGDGLIEIYSLDQLALLRDDLNGDGADDGRFGEIDAVGSVGCPDDEDGGCVGYELTRSLNFSDPGSYEDPDKNMDTWTKGRGWVPIGFCLTPSSCRSNAYAGIFDGNHHSIANLFIATASTRDTQGNSNSSGVGLFGAMSDATVQNLHLLNGTIHVNQSLTGDSPHRYVGLLVGYGYNGHYENLSASGSVMTKGLNIFELVGGSSWVGTLAGRIAGTKNTLIRVSAKIGTLSGYRDVGGLVGSAENTRIRDAYAVGGTISVVEFDGGGLLGECNGCQISHAYTDDIDISLERSTNRVAGGLIGTAGSSNIILSYAKNIRISGKNHLGGLIGDGRSAGQNSLTHSYASGGSLSTATHQNSGSSNGGLIGRSDRSDGDDQVRYSYAAIEPVAATKAKGLIGEGNASVTDSYWDSTINTAGGGRGQGNTTAELQMPTADNFNGTLYATWGRFWCDPNSDPGSNEVTESDLQPAGFLPVWHLGNSTQYPALNCMPGGLAAQRPESP